ncbi:hypothetical protein RRG08_005189 [Elysia crispata]|uniref:Uncharacterized protein n=1 Tax=Elysia crispata TaxID=231223 RepID=A0AAE1DH41_9GAST|nr:hypothetical protein RRG08_005189 [Elysia crispata]
MVVLGHEIHVQTKSHGVIKRHQNQIRVIGYDQSNHTDYPDYSGDSNPQAESEIEAEKSQTPANLRDSKTQSEFNEQERGGGMTKDMDSVICTDTSSPPSPTAQTPRVGRTDSGGSISPNESVPPSEGLPEHEEHQIS